MKAPRPKSSLLTKMLLAVFISVLLTALGSFVFSNLAARAAFGRYVTQFAGMRRQNVIAALEEHYRTTGGWSGVGPLLDLALRQGSGRGPGPGSRGGGGMRMGEFDRITLVSPSGVVIADTGGTAPGTQLRFESWEATPITSGRSAVALLLMGGPEHRQASSVLYSDFVSTTTRGTLYSAAGAAILALALSYYIAERTVKPIRELMGAAANIAEGRFATRVKEDVTDEIGELGRAFNHMSSRLETLEKQRRDLVADVAHELRTPLTVLKSNLEAVKDGVIDPTPDLMAMLLGEADRLSRLVADLHVLALADSGKLDIVLDPVSCRNVLTHVKEAFSLVARDKAIVLQVEIAEDIEILADWPRLIQVLTNLVDNALRYTPRGGRITLGAVRDFANGESLARLSVVDTGSGMPEAELPHVFDRFYRGDRSRSRKTGGSGLGLAIAKQLIDAHQGHISVASQVDKGTSFVITLKAIN